MSGFSCNEPWTGLITMSYFTTSAYFPTDLATQLSA